MDEPVKPTLMQRIEHEMGTPPHTDDRSSVGRKADTGKRRFSLLPWNAVRAIVDVLEFGARKYGLDNWKRVPEARTRYYDATVRHIDAWWDGERNDPESGKHHLAHAGCCILFLLWFELTETLRNKGV